MRPALRPLAAPTPQHLHLPDHAGLAYGVWAPFALVGEKPGKIPDADKGRWLQAVSEIRPPEDYRHAFNAWKASFEGCARLAVEVELSSRLLVGHGLPSPNEVGLHLHHTWGTPLIPGSALKGLLAHYLQASYGPAVGDEGDELQAREPWRGVEWRDKAPQRGPGEAYRAIFGAPDAKQDEEGNPNQGMIRGRIQFHDALWVPEVASPLALDVLTPHHAQWYQGKAQEPNDYDDPTPVPFLTVRPGQRFWVVLSGAPEDLVMVKFALTELVEALSEWGVGGKTAAGYGRVHHDKALAALGEELTKHEQRQEELRQASLSPQDRAHSWAQRADEGALFDWALAEKKRQDQGEPDTEERAAIRAALSKHSALMSWGKGYFADEKLRIQRKTTPADRYKEAVKGARWTPPAQAAPEPSDQDPLMKLVQSVTDKNGLKNLEAKARAEGWTRAQVELLIKKAEELLPKKSRSDKDKEWLDKLAKWSKSLS
jgi:CRISPR-associated protein Cmr6